MIVLPLGDSSQQHLLGMTVTVTERDPSKAADRNKRTAEALKELTPLLVDYAKDKAGVADDPE